MNEINGLLDALPLDEAELRTKVAVARGARYVVYVPGSVCFLEDDFSKAPKTSEWKIVDEVPEGCTEAASNVADPLKSMDAAWPLARDLMEKGYGLSFYKENSESSQGYMLIGGAGQGLVIRPQASEMLCICLAWYQVHIGRLVELKAPGDDCGVAITREGK